MSKIKLSEIVAKSLLDATNLFIERDEKGMFLRWDSLSASR